MPRVRHAGDHPTSPADLDPALTVKEIGTEFGICRASVYRMLITPGVLPTFKVGTSRRARRSVVRDVKARLEAEATPA